MKVGIKYETTNLYVGQRGIASSTMFMKFVVSVVSFSKRPCSMELVSQSVSSAGESLSSL